MLKLVRKLKDYYITRKMFVQIFKDNKKFLKSGQYVPDKTFTYFYLKKMEHDKNKSKLFSDVFSVINYKVSKLKTILDFIFIKFFYKDFYVINKLNSKENFKGVICLPKRLLDGCKFFDFDNKKVLTIFFEEKAYYRQKKLYNYYSKFFNNPKILLQDDEKKIIVEKLKIYLPSKEWGKEDYQKVFSEIEDTYYNYLLFYNQKGIIKKTTVSELVKVLPKNRLVNLVIEGIEPKLLKVKIPVLKLHGDLSLLNILFVKSKEIFFIDWENSGDYMFFYDIFSFIYFEKIYAFKYDYFKKYISGEYDNYFKRLFKLVNLEFSSNYRKSYFSIFFLELYKNWWLDNTEKTEDQIIKIYNNFFEGK